MAVLAGLVGTGPTLVVGGVGGALGVLWLLRSPVISIRAVDDLPDPNDVVAEATLDAAGTAS